MMPSASPRAVMACCSLGVISWETSAVEMSAAISRSSMTLTVTACPRPAASAVARSAVRSASSRVEDGSLVPALTTASRNALGCSWWCPLSRLSRRSRSAAASFRQIASSCWSSPGVSPAVMARATLRACRRPTRRCTARPAPVSDSRTLRPSAGSGWRSTRPRSASRSTRRDRAGWLSRTCRFSSLMRIGAAHLDSVYSTSYSRMDTSAQMSSAANCFISTACADSSASHASLARCLLAGHHSSGYSAARSGSVSW